jgi:hypothetical protein
MIPRTRGTFKCPQCSQRLPNCAKFCRRCGRETTDVIRPTQSGFTAAPRRAGVVAWVVFSLVLFAGMSSVIAIFTASVHTTRAPAFRTARPQPPSDVPLHLPANEPVALQNVGSERSSFAARSFFVAARPPSDHR